MTGADDLARRLVARHGGDNPGPGAFETLHQIIAALRQLPLSLVAAAEDPAVLSDLPPMEAELLWGLVRKAGPQDAATTLFIAIAQALDRSPALSGSCGSAAPKRPKSWKPQG